MAEAIAGQSEAESVAVFNSAEVLTEGPREWVLGVRAASRPGASVILRRVDQLPNDVAAATAATVARADGVRFVGTAEEQSSTEPGRAELLDQLNVLTITVPPLRSRREDIAPLVRHFAALAGRHDIDSRVLNLLYRQPWNGNVTELRHALRSGMAKARTERLAVRHLPRRIQKERNRRPLHGLHQQEADAIVAAINATSTRAEAAAQLGISRATLFRRIKTYGLDLDGG